jgi:hypothetical protein
MTHKKGTLWAQAMFCFSSQLDQRDAGQIEKLDSSARIVVHLQTPLFAPRRRRWWA